MDALSFMTHSGSSPGASNDSFVCSGSSPTSPRVRPSLYRAASVARIPKHFRFVNRLALVCLRGGR